MSNMWKFLKSAAKLQDWPLSSGSEICFIGRSNVGKSSLINALLKAKLARTSRTPGRTQLVNFFTNGSQMVVDLPGYGYAKMSRGQQAKLGPMITTYLTKRPQLKMVYLLVDGKIGPQPSDMAIIKLLQDHHRHFVVILTKRDRTNQAQRHQTTKIIEKLGVPFLFVSASTGTNMNQVLQMMAQF